MAFTAPVRSLRFTRAYEGPNAFRGQAAHSLISISNPGAGAVTMFLNLIGSIGSQALAQRKTKAMVKAGNLDLSKIVIRSEVAVVREVKTFSTCPVPLDVTVSREIYGDGPHEYWVRLDTAPVAISGQSRKNCRLRTAIEERHRQLKCYSDLEAFTSRAFSLVAHQVVFYSSHVQPDAMVLAADRPKGTQSQDPNAYHGPSTSDRHSYCHLLQELRRLLKPARTSGTGIDSQ